MKWVTMQTLEKPRPSRDEYYLTIATAVATRSTCIKRRYGAVIVNHGEIVSTGYNGNVRGELNCCDIQCCLRPNAAHNNSASGYSDCRSVHAEQNALISASRREMEGGTIYLSAIDENYNPIFDLPGPCPICDRMIRNAGIKQLCMYKVGGDGIVRASVTEF